MTKPIRWLRQWRWNHLAPWSAWGDDFPDADVPMRSDGTERLVALYTDEQIREAIEWVKADSSFGSWTGADIKPYRTGKRDSLDALAAALGLEETP